MLRRALLALSLSLAATPAFARDDDTSAQDKYERGLKLMKRGYFTKALEQFQSVANYHRDDPISLLAELGIADLHFKRNEYEQARISYENFSRLHPNHARLDYVTYRTGLSIYKRAPTWAGRDQAPTQEAVDKWERFLRKYPDSEYEADVQRLLGKCRNRLASKEQFIARFYKRKHRWLAVRKRAETLLARYPDSRYAPGALMLVGMAYHQTGDLAQAQEIRGALASNHPQAPELKRLERFLQRPPGEPEDEPIFVRPYRLPGMGPMQ